MPQTWNSGVTVATQASHPTTHLQRGISVRNRTRRYQEDERMENMNLQVLARTGTERRCGWVSTNTVGLRMSVSGVRQGRKDMEG